MPIHDILCEQAEQAACNVLIHSIAGRKGTFIAKADPELITDWHSWKLGDWVAVCSVKKLADPDEEVTEFEVCLRNTDTIEEVSRKFDRTGGEIKHAHFWVLKCLRDQEYRKQWEQQAPGMEG